MLSNGARGADGGGAAGLCLPGAIWVAPWRVDGRDCVHDARSVYVERYWLAGLGPTSLLCLRMVADGLGRSPGGFELDTAAAASQLGVSPRGGAKGLGQALRRLEQFQIAAQAPGGAVWSVRRWLPEAPPHVVARLPQHLRRAHRADADAAARGEWTWDRAAAVAAALGAGGEPAEVVARLLRWFGAPQAMAAEAARQAAARPE